MFDVVLAKSFKKLFSEKFIKLFSQKDLTKETMTAAIRELAINSLIKSWSEVCSVLRIFQKYDYGYLDDIYYKQLVNTV